jgi:adenylate cyclase
MTEQRRLAAIVSADVAGYSRLMGRDESGTLAALKALRQQVVDPAIARYGGRIVKTTGDGLLMEFASAVNAVRCASEIQAAMAARNVEVPADRRIEFRVGVNVGDVIVDGDDIFGDGVNVAARLQEMAEPGAVYVSESAHQQVRDKLEMTFTDLGERQAKNIARAVRVWRVQSMSSPGAPDAPSVAAASNTKRERAARPSLAVLPFDNLGGDAEIEGFCDGLSEELITALSGFRWLSVVSRKSSFAYKGRSPDIRHVAQELGVTYVVEGSVRRTGNRVRINAQLLEAHGGTHAWARRYDRELGDPFALQDEVVRHIAGSSTTCCLTSWCGPLTRQLDRPIRCSPRLGI